MKRIILLLLSLSLCLNFSGCGKEIKDIFVKSANKLSDTMAENIRKAEDAAQDAGETISEIKDSFSELEEAASEVENAFKESAGVGAEKNVKGQEDPEITENQQKALNFAKNWLAMDYGYSKTSLISELKLNGISYDDARYAAEHCDADWNQEALKSAKFNLEYYSYSRIGLIRLLKYYTGYTYAEASYGVDNCGADWNKQALKSAEDYLDSFGISKSVLEELLQTDGFKNAEVEYAFEHCDADWFEQASMAAKRHMMDTEYSKEELIEQLESEGFSLEQATYGVEQNGYITDPT